MAPEHRPDEASIREQAYYLWEQDGRPQGHEMEYWQRASVAMTEGTQLSTLTEAAPKRAKAPTSKAAASKIRAAPTKMSKTKDAPKAKPKKK